MRFPPIFRRSGRSVRQVGTAITLVAVSLGVAPAMQAAIAPASGEPVSGAASGAPVLPHLKLKRASPAPDTTLAVAPSDIRLWFSEDADLVATRITVTASNGVRIAMGKPARAPGRDMPITASFSAPLTPGRYTVAWKTMSKDGHVVSGSYAFTFATR